MPVVRIRKWRPTPPKIAGPFEPGLLSVPHLGRPHHLIEKTRLGSLCGCFCTLFVHKRSQRFLWDLYGMTTAVFTNHCGLMKKEMTSWQESPNSLWKRDNRFLIRLPLCNPCITGSAKAKRGTVIEAAHNRMSSPTP